MMSWLLVGALRGWRPAVSAARNGVSVVLLDKQSGLGRLGYAGQCHHLVALVRWLRTTSDTRA